LNSIEKSYLTSHSKDSTTTGNSDTAGVGIGENRRYGLVTSTIGTSEAGAGSTGTNFGVGSVISGVEVTTKAEGAGLDEVVHLLSCSSISLTSMEYDDLSMLS